jgi:hypothetical protein
MWKNGLKPKKTPKKTGNNSSLKGEYMAKI